MASKRRKIYETYLESGHWKNLRRQAFERDNYQCTKCGKRTTLRGHHLRYRGNLRKCTVDDIVTLCEQCHTNLHRRKKKERKLKRIDKKAMREFHEGRAAWWRLLHNVPTQAFALTFYDRENALDCLLFLQEQEMLEPPLTLT